MSKNQNNLLVSACLIGKLIRSFKDFDSALDEVFGYLKIWGFYL
jgi:hypothetical protein